jgi:membrane-bound ClpP family serine protease
MWIIAGILLGIVLLTALLGFHAGPHTHLVTGIAGTLAAVWLIVMAIQGNSSSLLWAIFAADTVLSGGLGALAWRSLRARHAEVTPQLMASERARSVEGLEGVAVGDLSPEGVVRVRGEQWSAVSVNGEVRRGDRVRVVNVSGLRLEVWREDPESLEETPTSEGAKSLFVLEEMPETAPAGEPASEPDAGNERRAAL